MCIQQAINDRVQDKAVVIIAHRLHTIQAGDKIVVMDRGRIVEEGRHDDLPQAGGLYRSLWDQQQRIEAKGTD